MEDFLYTVLGLAVIVGIGYAIYKSRQSKKPTVVEGDNGALVEACPNCHSTNLKYEVVNDISLKNKHHSIWYWVTCYFLIDWIIKIFLWLWFTIPMLFVKLFGHKKQVVKQNQRTVVICQDCGHTWNK